MILFLFNNSLCTFELAHSFQVLRDRELQGWRHRGQQAQGGHTPRRRRHQQVQEGEPHHVRLGDQGPPALGGGLQPGECAQRLQH